MQKLALILPLTGLMLLFTGCVKQPKFNKNRLHEIRASGQFDKEIENQGVTLGIRTLTKQETIEIFDKDIHKNSIYPIILNFDNKSEKSYIFSSKSICGLNIINKDKLFDLLKVKFTGSTAIGIALLSLVPAALLAGSITLPIIGCNDIVKLFIAITGWFYTISFPACTIMYASDSSHTNKEIKALINQIDPSKVIEINSNSQENIVCFADSDPKEFDVTLFDKQDIKNLDFYVNLPKQ